ncbi:hypothetical protein CANARDRAFT_23035 [[Candida] arabinofermentans NRRL YB-2248]|uniref:Essential protein Yae1 N-terminal domain-containing protein n=1 Tax=[Candida] arabinofermentans NRRL YB-2248 TaxID=983967 RepID=A0A1E4T1A9_9ASCO|nr:hypothetical protein CANARDRAFT_23035 [[Candida] arabinofermentans NRRL YB-2248]
MKNSETDSYFDFDSVLNLEDQYYNEGFNEGQLEGSMKQFHEGKELGIQTGYQRLLIIGQLRTLVNYWIEKIDRLIESNTMGTESSSSDLSVSVVSVSVKKPKRDNHKVKKTLDGLKMLLDSLYDNDKINLTNSDEDVQTYETILKKARAKVRSLSTVLGDEELYASIERLSLQVGGTIPTSGITGADEDMW